MKNSKTTKKNDTNKNKRKAGHISKEKKEKKERKMNVKEKNHYYLRDTKLLDF